MIPADRNGDFRAEILEYGLREEKTGSVGVVIKCHLHELWDAENEVWVPWDEYDMEAYGTLYVVKKDGTLNDHACKSLIRNADWDGDIESIQNKTWKPAPIQVTIKSDTYKDETKYKIAFVNAFDSIPGGLGTLDDAKAKQLKEKFGSSLRAMYGSEKQNSIPANGKPPKPPMSKKNAASVAAQEPVTVDTEGDPIFEPRG